jgi:predicted SAM-dependent methyltransferase
MAGAVRKLNLGCGPYPIDGYVNIDANPRQKPDLCRDVRRGLPYDDASVDHIVASHFLEHLSCDEMLDVMEECYRVLKPGCVLSITVPLMEFSSLDHKQFMGADSFDIFGRDAAEYFNRKFVWVIQSKQVVKGERGEHLKISLAALK